MNSELNMFRQVFLGTYEGYTFDMMEEIKEILE